ncbi:MAG: hypothetical protein HKO04_03350 [Silicimonas sp.]|nr:hypothetical protein [Silicimonas sp.]
MTDTAQTDEEIRVMVLGASAPRLWLGVACTAGLGALLFWIVFAGRPAMSYQIAFIAAAGLSLWMADRLRRAGQDPIVLTTKVLKTESGRVLTTVDNVRSVERGAFAFKPPNGFLVRLKEPAGKGWVPGLWWQRGRMIGVGGVVSGGQSRAMAETLTALTLGVVPDIRAP